MKRLIYKLGMRPSPGSIWYSPSLDWRYFFEKAMRTFAKQNAERQMMLQEVEAWRIGQIEQLNKENNS